MGYNSTITGGTTTINIDQIPNHVHSINDSSAVVNVNSGNIDVTNLTTTTKIQFNYQTTSVSSGNLTVVGNNLSASSPSAAPNTLTGTVSGTATLTDLTGTLSGLTETGNITPSNTPQKSFLPPYSVVNFIIKAYD